ncbi:MAG TPA: hypothetical protein VLB44_01165 [Kofleriaceae bacterium]|nr:hypothetical protein [Kofleriaceae bacterium]
MADEPPPDQPAGPPPDAPVWPRLTKAERIEAVREMLDRGYSTAEVRTWASSKTDDKGWQVSRICAGRYVNAALESIDAEVVAPKNRKQARVRGMLALFARRAYDLATDDGQKHKAAGLITAGVAALDKIARIDGSYAYDPSSMLPPSVNPTTPEDAVRLVAHAQALVELAKRRGALVSASVPPPVIDATAVEVDEDDADEGAELDDDDAN